MKLVTYEENGVDQVGLLTRQDSEIIPVAEAEKIFLRTSFIPNTMLGIIVEEAKVLPQLQSIQEKFAIRPCPTISVNAVKLLAPIPRPTKNIFCVGENYYDHVKESATFLQNEDVPQYPTVFSKVPTAVTGPNTIVKKQTVTQLDYEAELAIIIGKKGIRITKEAAYEHVFGYSIINDVSARDLQLKYGQWLIGKSCDTFAPMGPCIIHRSAVLNPQDLAIQCKINGEIRQSANTGDMIFDIPTIIETISSVITLEPGDIIASGTPSGVGLGLNPPKFLNIGDVMEIAVAGIGVLRNTIG